MQVAILSTERNRADIADAGKGLKNRKSGTNTCGQSAAASESYPFRQKRFKWSSELL